MPIINQRLNDVKRELEQLPFFLCVVIFLQLEKSLIIQVCTRVTDSQEVIMQNLYNTRA
jgi:hypothetical protein